MSNKKHQQWPQQEPQQYKDGNGEEDLFSKVESLEGMANNFQCDGTENWWLGEQYLIVFVFYKSLSCQEK